MRAPGRLLSVGLLSALLSCGLVLESSPPSQEAALATGQAGGGDYPAYRHDAHSTWYNPGLFAASDALALSPAWTFSAGSSTFAEPILAGGAVYYTTAGVKGGSIYSLNAATGAVRWVRKLNGSVTDSCNGTQVTPGIQGAPTVMNGVVYIGSPDGGLYALDANTGATLWRAAIADPTKGEVMIDSPVVSLALGRVFIGTSAVDEACLKAPKIASVDLATGVPLVRGYLPPGHVGSSIWSSLTIDEPANKVFATTGNSPTGPSGDALSQAFIAFDAATLSVVDFWQNPNHLSTDSDFGASPTLFEASDGTQLAAAGSKDGWLYVLNRANLAHGPVWQYQLALLGGPTADRGSLVAPSFAEGVLYGAGGKTPQGEIGSIVAFDPGTGAVLWKHVTPGYVLPGMPILGNVLIAAATAVANTSATIELLDRTTGAVIRDFPVSAAVWGAPSAGDGMLLYTDIHGHLNALVAPIQTDAGTPDAGTPDAGTPDGGTGEAVLFSDPLTGSGPLGLGWKIASGAFARGTNGATPSALHSYALSTIAAPQSATVSAELSITSASRYNGLLLRADASAPAANQYVAYWNGDGRLWIARRNSFTYTYLASTAAIALAPSSHRIALRATATPAAVELTLLLDGNAVLTVVDQSAQRLTAAGLAGIFSYNGSGAVFRDFQIETP